MATTYTTEDLEIIRKIFDEDELEHGCGYYSQCLEHACPCSPSAPVSQGFNIDVWNRLSEEKQAEMDFILGSDDYDDYDEIEDDDLDYDVKFVDTNEAWTDKDPELERYLEGVIHDTCQRYKLTPDKIQIKTWRGIGLDTCIVAVKCDNKTAKEQMERRIYRNLKYHSYYDFTTILTAADPHITEKNTYYLTRDGEPIDPAHAIDHIDVFGEKYILNYTGKNHSCGSVEDLWADLKAAYDKIEKDRLTSWDSFTYAYSKAYGMHPLQYHFGMHSREYM